MNIVHVFFSFNTGGSETMLADIMSNQCDDGDNVYLLIINNTTVDNLTKILDRRIKICCVGRPEGSKNPYWVLKYNYLLHKIHPDIVHYHNDKAAGLTIKAIRSKYVMTVHSMGQSLPYSNKCDAIISISKAVADDIQTRLGLSSVVIANGMFMDDIAVSESTYRPQNPFKIVMTGRMYLDVKGQDILLTAIKTVVDQGYNVQVTFWGDGPDLDKCKSLAKQLGIAERTFFAGLVSRDYVHSNLKKFDLYVLPSRHEGYGLSCVEAMAAGVPIIVSDIDGPSELVGDNEYGLKFAPEDSQSLADAIVRVLTNYAVYKRCAMEKSLPYSARFNVKNTARSYTNLYHKILDK